MKKWAHKPEVYAVGSLWRVWCPQCGFYGDYPTRRAANYAAADHRRRRS